MDKNRRKEESMYLLIHRTDVKLVHTGKSELDYFPKGHYSIKDKIGNLMKSEEAWDILREKGASNCRKSHSRCTDYLVVGI